MSSSDEKQNRRAVIRSYVARGEQLRLGMDGDGRDWTASPVRTLSVDGPESGTPAPQNLRGLRYSSQNSAFRYVETLSSSETEEPTFTRALLTPGPLFVPGADELTDVHKTISKFDYRLTVTEHEERERSNQRSLTRSEEKTPVSDEFLISDSLIYPDVRPNRAHRYSNDYLDHEIGAYLKADSNPFSSFKYSSRQRGPTAPVSSSLESWNSSEFNILAEAPEVDLHRLEKAANLAEYYGAHEDLPKKSVFPQNFQVPPSRILASNSRFLEDEGTIHQPRTALNSEQDGHYSFLGAPAKHAQNFELQLSQTSLPSSANRSRTGMPLSSSYEHYTGTANNKILRRAQFSDSPVRNAMRGSRDRRSEAQSINGSLDRSESMRKGHYTPDSSATKIAFKEFMQQYEAHLKIDPLTAHRFAEDMIELMHGNTRWRAYLELAESAKKNNDIALVTSHI